MLQLHGKNLSTEWHWYNLFIGESDWIFIDGDHFRSLSFTALMVIKDCNEAVVAAAATFNIAVEMSLGMGFGFR